MSAPPPEPPAGSSSAPEKTGDAASPSTTAAAGAAATEADGDVKMDDAKPADAAPVDPYEDLPDHVRAGSVDDIRMHTRLIDNEVKVRKRSSGMNGRRADGSCMRPAR